MNASTRLAAMAAFVFAPVIGCSSENHDTGGSGGSNGGSTISTGGTNASGGSTGNGGTAGAATSGGSAGISGQGGATAGSASVRPEGLPASNDKDDLIRFVADHAYRNPPWVPESAEPREMKPGSQHGGPVRVWLNPVLDQELKAGHDGRESRPMPDLWSMAVKELYDSTTGEVVGVAAMLKTAAGDGLDSWTYFCYGPDPRCLSGKQTTLDNPLFGNGSTSPITNCRICHGNSVFTEAP